MKLWGISKVNEGFSIQPCPYTVSLFPPWLWLVCWPQWQSQERKYTLWYQYSLISGSLLISNYLIKGRWIICGPEFLQTGADLHGSDVQLSLQYCHWLALSCWIYFCRCDLHRKFCFHPVMKADRVCRCQEENGVVLESPGGQIDLCKSSGFVCALSGGGWKSMTSVIASLLQRYCLIAITPLCSS